jgi:enamine deaminase RidA (YjgF/YER057c/UK114 family)
MIPSRSVLLFLSSRPKRANASAVEGPGLDFSRTRIGETIIPHSAKVRGCRPLHFSGCGLRVHFTSLPARTSVLALLFFLLFLPTRAQIKPVNPTPGQPSSAIEADGYLYISAQGPHTATGAAPTNFPAQVRQSLDNIKSILEAAHLNLDNLVYLQVYLENIDNYAALDQSFAAYFQKTPPARSVLGVAKLPEPQIQINAIAVRDLKDKQPVTPKNFKPGKSYSPGMLTHDRLFLSTMLGADPASGKIPDDPAAQVDQALDNMKSVCEAANLTLANMVFVNPYLTKAIPTQVMNQHYAKRFEFGNTPGRATIQVSSLPENNHIAYTGIAVRDLSQRHAIRPKNMPPSPTASPCVFAGDTLFCSAKSGFVPGPNSGVFAESTANQARQTMRNQLDNLEEAGMKFDQVVSVTIYLDNLSDSADYHRIYHKFFSGPLPAETLLQQIPPAPQRAADAEGSYPDLEQMSLIAVRSHKP